MADGGGVSPLAALLTGAASFIVGWFLQGGSRWRETQAFGLSISREMLLIVRKLTEYRDALSEFANHIDGRSITPIPLTENDMLVFSGNTSKVGLLDPRLTLVVLKFYQQVRDLIAECNRDWDGKEAEFTDRSALKVLPEWPSFLHAHIAKVSDLINYSTSRISIIEGWCKQPFPKKLLWDCAYALGLKTADIIGGRSKEGYIMDRERPSFRVAHIVILSLTLLVTAFAAYYTWQQVEVARQIGINQVRAYIFIKPYPWVNGVQENGNAQTGVLIRNGGQTPASQVAFRASLAVRQNPPEPTHEAFIATIPREIPNVIDSSAEMSTGSTFNTDRPIAPDEFRSIRAGQGSQLFVWGIASYKDVFGVERRSYFCFSYARLIDSPDGGIGSAFQGYCKHPDHT